MTRFLSAALAAVLLLFSSVAFAQDAAADQAIERARAGVDERRAVIADVRNSLSEEIDTANLVELQEQLRTARSRAEGQLAPVRNAISDYRTRLAELGPAPEDGTLEADEVVETRQSLQRRIADLDAILKQANVNSADIDLLLKDIDEERQARFYADVFEGGASPFSPGLVGRAVQNAASGVLTVQGALNRKIADLQADGTLVRTLSLIGGAVVLAIVLFIPVRRFLTNRITRRIERYEPTEARKALAAAARIIARAAPALLGGFIVMEAMALQGLITEGLAAAARATWLSLVAIVVADAMSNAIFSPRLPAWRVIAVKSSSAAILKTLAVVAVGAYSADIMLTSFAPMVGGTEDTARIQSALLAFIIGAVLIALSSKSLWARPKDAVADPEAEKKSEMTGRRLRVLSGLAGATIIIAAAIGYVALAYYAASRVVLLVCVFAIGWFARALAREGVEALERRLRGEAAEDDEEREKNVLFFWIGAVVDVLVFFAFAPFALVILGAAWADVFGVVRAAFEGFEVPGTDFRVSFSKIVAAALSFIVIYAMTRFLQRTAETKLLPQTKLDSGLQNSLKTLIGYAGLILAFMAGVSALGFDFSNLAIIAGALSVGIGFGLQSIVNNFVSGLILLFERPIKVGDWIVTSSGEGIVKRISVRSTEIETFDRSSVIVPNSELISGSVTNWTHKSAMGRVVVPVGVSYDEDPERIIKILQEVADAQPNALRYPSPFVYFGGFGDSSLDFDVRLFIRDINSSLSTKRDLRVAIFKRFREENVEIPFPQRDLHVRSADGLPVRFRDEPQAKPKEQPADEPKAAE
ncbi:MAG: mechanosensitive ion channel domain-containing protein [Pseudomonadota bacterium]